MAVTDVKELHKSMRGRLTEVGMEYQASYLVTVDSAKDGVETILDDTRLPVFNSVYQFGNDYDAGARLRSIDPKRYKGRLLWRTDCTWRTPSPLNGDRDNENDPETGVGTGDERDLFSGREYKTLEILMRTTRRVVTLATFVGTYVAMPGADALRRAFPDSFPVGSIGPIRNSAGQPKIPAPEVDDANLIFRTTRAWPRWKEEWDREYIGSINHAELFLRDPSEHKFFVRKLPKHTMKCNSITLDEPLTSSSNRMWVTMEVEYKRDTWLHDELDFGDARLVEIGLPDGYGGHFPEDLESAGHFDGVAQNAVIRDVFGEPVGPVLLDGGGLPLGFGGAGTPNAIYQRYRNHRLKDFSKLWL